MTSVFTQYNANIPQFLINIDYKNIADAYNKVLFFNLIMPFMSGLCANSPIENNVLTNKKLSKKDIVNKMIPECLSGKIPCFTYLLMIKNLFND